MSDAQNGYIAGGDNGVGANGRSPSRAEGTDTAEPASTAVQASSL